MNAVANSGISGHSIAYRLLISTGVSLLAFKLVDNLAVFE